MCGIAGIISCQHPAQTDPRLSGMCRTLSHRGPDGEGYFENKQDETYIGLAHRRLAVIDLSEMANQPMPYLNRYHIIHNGEVFNYREIRDALKKQGFTFRSKSDTEVIAAAYHRHGEACLDYFDGMFAFAIWDEKEETLFAARDRFGEKPFFYSWNDITGELLFASEMKAIWNAGVERKINHSMLLQYLATGQVNAPSFPGLTFFEGISQLPPSSFMRFRPADRQPEIIRYWDLDKEQQPDITEKEAIARFNTLFELSISRRLRSDLPIGTSLSGGIDSSSIVAACNLAEAGTYSHACFSAVFPGFDRDESVFARTVAGQFNLIHHLISPEPEDLVQDISNVLYHQEEPLSSTSVYAQYAVFRLAKAEGITVLLDGQGADEMLAGYTRYPKWYLQEQIAGGKWQQVRQEAARLKANGFLPDWSAAHYVSAFFPALTAALLERRVRAREYGTSGMETSYLETHFKSLLIHKPVVTKLNDILYADALEGGLQELLRYADRNAMAFGRELRLPFLFHELVAFVFSLPSGFKIREGYTKWLLRSYARNKLPASIVWRKGKTGFEPPQAAWMMHEKVRVQISLAKQKLVDHHILRPAVLKKSIIPGDAYALENYDWRYWMASFMI